jgi:hypothetical protein
MNVTWSRQMRRNQVLNSASPRAERIAASVEIALSRHIGMIHHSLVVASALQPPFKAKRSSIIGWLSL